MKTVGKMMIALLLVAGMISGCNKKEDRIENTVQRGTWQITLFQEDDDIETNKFSGYVFAFDDNGTVMATNGPVIANG